MSRSKPSDKGTSGGVLRTPSPYSAWSSSLFSCPGLAQYSASPDVFLNLEFSIVGEFFGKLPTHHLKKKKFPRVGFC